VVDDNDTAALVLAEMLREIGFVVECANSGEQALRRVQEAAGQQQPFDVVALDWLMPGMDGLEVARALQDMQLQPEPRLLMLSAYRRDDMVRMAELLGIRHVLAKPVSAALLINTMLEIMGHKSILRQQNVKSRRDDFDSSLALLAGARILLVEDNEINQQVACELLISAGFAVDVAEHGQVALSRVQARQSEDQPYDLVLMDMQMPVMDGLTATRLLRETLSAQVLPIVAMTANAMKVDRDRCLQAGMNAVVTKPISPEALWQALVKWIKPRPGLGVRPVEQGTDGGTWGAPAAAIAPDAVAEMATPDMEQTLLSLRQIEVLELDLGLSHINQNADLYRSILIKFVASQADAASHMAECITHADTATAERMAHTLKGLAGNLGATLLQTSAEQLETALREQVPPEQVQQALEHSAAALQTLIRALHNVPHLLPAPQPVLAGITAAQRLQALALTEQIKGLLQEDDARAQELWESHATVLAAVHARAQDIERAISAFDFETALDLLQ
jgi:two-component system sensor histidine kinase/response regulator